jgi:hypothetical protein
MTRLGPTCSRSRFSSDPKCDRPREATHRRKPSAPAAVAECGKSKSLSGQTGIAAPSAPARQERGTRWVVRDMRRMASGRFQSNQCKTDRVTCSGYGSSARPGGLVHSSWRAVHALELLSASKAGQRASTQAPLCAAVTLRRPQLLWYCCCAGDSDPATSWWTTDGTPPLALHTGPCGTVKLPATGSGWRARMLPSGCNAFMHRA